MVVKYGIIMHKSIDNIVSKPLEDLAEGPVCCGIIKGFWCF